MVCGWVIFDVRVVQQMMCPKHWTKHDVRYEKWAVEIWPRWRLLISGINLRDVKSTLHLKSSHIFHRLQQLWCCSNNNRKNTIYMFNIATVDSNNEHTFNIREDNSSKRSGTMFFINLIMWYSLLSSEIKGLKSKQNSDKLHSHRVSIWLLTHRQGPQLHHVLYTNILP